MCVLKYRNIPLRYKQKNMHNKIRSIGTPPRSTTIPTMERWPSYEAGFRSWNHSLSESGEFESSRGS